MHVHKIILKFQLCTFKDFTSPGFMTRDDSNQLAQLQKLHVYISQLEVIA